MYKSGVLDSLVSDTHSDFQYLDILIYLLRENILMICKVVL